MTVFYRGPRALITHRTIEVWCPRYRVFAIRELSYVHVIGASPTQVDRGRADSPVWWPSSFPPGG
jgi:hypothetical protein